MDIFCSWIGRKGLIALLLTLAGVISFGGAGTAFADPQHCYSYGECYNIGYRYGYADEQNGYNPVTIIPKRIVMDIIKAIEMHSQIIQIVDSNRTNQVK